MDKIKLVFKGFLIGIGKILPGISGGLIAISLNVYEPAIKAINTFFKNKKNNIIFLSLLGLGIIISLVTMSNIIKKSLYYFYIPTMSLFIGMMLSSFKTLNKELINHKKYLLYLLLPIIITLFLAINVKTYNIQINVITLIIFGIIDAFTMVIPGISGTAILMILGFYPILLETLSNLLNINFLIANLYILIPFIIGLIIGLIMSIKIVYYGIEKNRTCFYYIVTGLFISSIILLIKQIIIEFHNINNIFYGIIFFIIGFILSKKLDY